MNCRSLCLTMAVLACMHRGNTQAGGTRSSETKSPRSLLRPGYVVKTELTGAGLLGQARCDARRRIYVRIYSGQLLGEADSLRVPVMRLDSSGKVTGKFPISDAGSDLVAADFFVTAAGELHQAAFDPSTRDVYLVTFSEEGTIERKVRLEAEFEPYYVAVFTSGQVLVSGLRYPNQFGKRAHEPYTALFAASGKLLKELHFPEDDYLAAEAEKGNPAFASPSSREQGNLAIEYGDVASASNGNVYLMRRTSPVFVHEISAQRGVVRTLKIYPRMGWMPVTLKSAQGKVAILLEKEGAVETAIKIVNSRGNSIRTQIFHQRVGHALSCYAPPYFLFAGSANNMIELYRTDSR